MMYPMTIKEVAAAVGGRLFANGADTAQIITSVVRDDSEVKSGSLFLCFRGERFDGHDFAQLAFEKGAVCVIAERDLPDAKGAVITVESTGDALRALGAHYRKKLKIPVIGVTGSVGKTTAKEFIAAVLSEKLNVHKTPENLNNELGVPLTLLQTETFHTAAVVEMGISGFGEMTHLAEMALPDICVVTSIGHAHLEQLGDLDGVLRAKSEVFPLMSPGALAILCGDDEKLRDYNPGIKKLTYGFGEHNDFRAEKLISDGVSGVSFDITGQGMAFSAEIPAFGEHLALGALAATAVGSALGLTAEEIARGLRKYAPVGSRSGVITTSLLTIIDDCYNANPHSMSAALRSLAGLSGRRVALLGDMLELGDGANELHREIGMLAGELGIDCIICCGEKAEFIFKGFIAQGSGREAYHFPFREALLERLPSLVQKDDTVLVKASRGMRFEELVDALRGI